MLDLAGGMRLTTLPPRQSLRYAVGRLLTHRLLGVAVTGALLITALARAADDGKPPSPDPFADESDTPDASSAPSRDLSPTDFSSIRTAT